MYLTYFRLNYMTESLPRYKRNTNEPRPRHLYSISNRAFQTIISLSPRPSAYTQTRGQWNNCLESSCRYRIQWRGLGSLVFRLYLLGFRSYNSCHPHTFPGPLPTFNSLHLWTWYRISYHPILSSRKIWWDRWSISKKCSFAGFRLRKHICGNNYYWIVSGIIFILFL